jgi:hypothetical protein
LAPISYWVAWAVSGRRWQSWLAGLLAIFSGFYFPFWTAIDNFTPFAIAGSLSLLMAWQVMTNSQWSIVNGKWQTTNGNRQKTKGQGPKAKSEAQIKIQNPKTKIQNLLAGVFAGLAHLARADGLLLLVAIILIYPLHLIFHPTDNTHHRIRNPALNKIEGRPYILRFTFYIILGYALIITPWFIRNWLVAGSPLPTGGSQTIWLSTGHNLFDSYSGLFSYGRELSAQSFFAQGLGPILQGRWWVLIANLQTVLAVWGMIFLAPLALVGVWRLRYHVLIQLASLYALLLFSAMTLVFAFPGAMGGLFHSGTALLPFIYATATAGLESAVDWVAAHRRHWNAHLAKRVFGAALVVMAVALSSFIYYRRVINHNAWNKADSQYPAIAAWVARENPTATVMINNPPAYAYHGGGLSVVVPNENIETTLQAARQYRVDYLILGPNRPAPLDEVYSQTLTHPQLALVKTFGNIYIFEIKWP